jgi:thioredoxin 1
MASANIVTVSQTNFDSEVAKSAVPVLVDFWAAWCGPCKMIAPILDELATEYQGRAKIAKVDVDQEGALAGQYGIMSIPALLFFKNGQVVQQIVGARSKKELKAALDGVLA